MAVSPEPDSDLIGEPDARHSSRWVREATRDAIRHFAWAIGDANPLWLDPEYAASSVYGRVTAPGCFLYSVDNTLPGPDTAYRFKANEWIWYDVVGEGDIVDVDYLPGPDTARIDYRVGSTVVATAHTRLHPSAPEEESRPRAPHHYGRDEIEKIESLILAETHRGGDPRYWEDVRPGDRIPGVTKGPLSIIDTIAWLSATQPPVPIVDSGFTFDGYRDPGPQRIAWAGHMITNWMGDAGFLHRLAVTALRPIDFGDTTFWTGRVSGTWIEGGVHLAALTIRATNQRGAEVASGDATVALPSRTAGPVPLPLPVSSLGKG